MEGMNETPEMRQTVQAYLDPVRQILEPANIAIFAGKIEYRKLSFLDRTLGQLGRDSRLGTQSATHPHSRLS
jgi:menaquinone-dependent protoporphyrinogen IX oxidase